MPQTVVKICLPLSEGRSTALVYNRSKSILQEMELTPDILALFGDRKKMYFAAHINSKDQLVIDRIMDHQRW